MTAFLLQYLPIVIFLGIAAILSVVFILAAALMAPEPAGPGEDFRLMNAASTPLRMRG